MINFKTAVWMVAVKFAYSDDVFSVFLQPTAVASCY